MHLKKNQCRELEGLRKVAGCALRVVRGAASGGVQRAAGWLFRAVAGNLARAPSTEESYRPPRSQGPEERCG